MRFNPGLGSGSSHKTNVGGPSASFGVWHEYVGAVRVLCERYGLKVRRIHTHIGSGNDPTVWQRAALLSQTLLSSFPSATILNLGGGFKVARNDQEVDVDFEKVGLPIAKAFQDFYLRSGRAIKLEIEPGTSLVANSGVIVSTIQDKITTKSPPKALLNRNDNLEDSKEEEREEESGYTFLKLDCGMNDVRILIISFLFSLILLT